MIEIKFVKDAVKYWKSVAERAQMLESGATVIERKLPCGCSNLMSYCEEHGAKRTANKKLEQENPQAYWRKITEGLEEEDRKQLLELWALREENAHLKLALSEPANLLAERVCNLMKENERLRRELDEANSSRNRRRND